MKLLYPIRRNLFQERDIWGDRISQYELHETQGVHYDYLGQIICFVNDNIVSLYEDEEIIKGCSFNSKITSMRVAMDKTNKGSFYFVTEGGGKDNQPLFIHIDTDRKYFLKFV